MKRLVRTAAVLLLPTLLAAQTPTDLPDSPELAQARRHLHRQEYDLAVFKLRKADEAAEGRRADVAFLLSLACYRTGAYKNAERAARRAIELSKDDPATLTEAYFLLGRSLSQAESKPLRRDSGKLAAAEDAFRQSLATGGSADSEAGHLALAETLYRLERDDEARAALHELLKNDGISDPAKDRARQLLDNPQCARGPCMPKLSFVAADGRPVTPEDLRGKVVMLSFWATWCGPCVAAMPDLKRLQARYEKEPFLMVGINRDHDRAAMDDYIARNGVTWPQVIDDASDRLQELMKVDAIPAEILFDHEGLLIGRSRGWGRRIEATLADRIEAALAKARKAGKAAGSPPS